MLRAAQIAGLTLIAAVCLGAPAEPVLIGFDVPLGTRIVATIRRPDGGTFWTKSMVADSVRPHLAGWRAAGRGHSLSVEERYPDGGKCMATGLVNPSVDDEYPVVYVERMAGGRCRLVDQAPWDVENSPPRAGDFPPYAPPWINQPPTVK